MIEFISFKKSLKALCLHLELPLPSIIPSGELFKKNFSEDFDFHLWPYFPEARHLSSYN